MSINSINNSPIKTEASGSSNANPTPSIEVGEIRKMGKSLAPLAKDAFESSMARQEKIISKINDTKDDAFTYGQNYMNKLIGFNYPAPDSGRKSRLTPAMKKNIEAKVDNAVNELKKEKGMEIESSKPKEGELKEILEDSFLKGKDSAQNANGKVLNAIETAAQEAAQMAGKSEIAQQERFIDLLSDSAKTAKYINNLAPQTKERAEKIITERMQKGVLFSETRLSRTKAIVNRGEVSKAEGYSEAADEVNREIQARIVRMKNANREKSSVKADA